MAAKEKFWFKYEIKDNYDNHREGKIQATSMDALKRDFGRRGFTFLLLTICQVHN